MLIDRVEQLEADRIIIIAYDGMSLDQAAEMHATFNEAGFYHIGTLTIKLKQAIYKSILLAIY